MCLCLLVTWCLYFSSVNIQHHCRHCGNIFCNECSAKNAFTPSSKKPVRVCETCFEELQGWFPLSFLYLPPKHPLTPLFPPPYLLQRTEEGASLSHLMCTIKDRPSAKTPHLHVTRGSGVEEFHMKLATLQHKGFYWRDTRAMWWDRVGFGWGIVCICFCAFATPVDCQRARQRELNTIHLFLSSYSHLLCCCLASLATARWLLCEFVNCLASVV